MSGVIVPVETLEYFAVTLQSADIYLRYLEPYSVDAGVGFPIFAIASAHYGQCKLIRHITTSLQQGGPAVCFRISCTDIEYVGMVWVKFSQASTAQACRDALVAGLRELKNNRIFTIEKQACKSFGILFSREDFSFSFLPKRNSDLTLTIQYPKKKIFRQKRINKLRILSSVFDGKQNSSPKIILSKT